MLRIDKDQKTMNRLAASSLESMDMQERVHLQRMICNSPSAFFAEIGEKMLLIGEEVKPVDQVEDRIDLLAIDEAGALVVVELKRSSEKRQLLQAISYAAMVADWNEDKVVKTFSVFSKIPAEDAREALAKFLDRKSVAVNNGQRAILIAEEFDFEVLATAKWLVEYGVDVGCWQLQVANDGEANYLSLACVFPPNDIGDVARVRRATLTGQSRWESWDDALRASSKAAPAVANFFRNQIKSGSVRSNLHRRRLMYQIAGVQRYYVAARSSRAYVWQRGRFDGDESFWQNLLGATSKVLPKASGRALSFRLAAEQQFGAFLHALDGDLKTKTFSHELPTEVDAELDESSEE